MRWTSRTPLLRWANAKVAWGGPLTGGHTRPRTATGGTPSDLSPINKYQELQRRPLTKPQIVPFWAAVSPGLGPITLRAERGYLRWYGPGLITRCHPALGET